MDDKKKIDNVRPLKPLPKSTNTAPEEPTERSFLANLFRENPDPVIAAAERAKRFGRTPQTNDNNQSGTFTK